MTKNQNSYIITFTCIQLLISNETAIYYIPNVTINNDLFIYLYKLSRAVHVSGFNKMILHNQETDEPQSGELLHVESLISNQKHKRIIIGSYPIMT